MPNENHTIARMPPELTKSAVAFPDCRIAPSKSDGKQLNHTAKAASERQHLLCSQLRTSLWVQCSEPHLSSSSTGCATPLSTASSASAGTSEASNLPNLAVQGGGARRRRSRLAGGSRGDARCRGGRRRGRCAGRARWGESSGPVVAIAWRRDRARKTWLREAAALQLLG